MNRRNVIIAIFLTAVVCRLVFPFVRETLVFRRPFLSFGASYLRSLPQSDDVYYNFTAKSLLSGHGFALNRAELIEASGGYDGNVNAANPLLVRAADGYFKHRTVMPFYPVWLAVCYRLFGWNTLAYYLPQVFLGALTCVLIFFIAEDLFGTAAAGIAGTLVAVYPDLALWTYQVRVETLFIFLLAALFCLLAGLTRRPNGLAAAGLGVIMGLACLTRITLIYFVPVIVLWLAVKSEGGLKKGALPALGAACFCGAVLFPWAWRNLRVFGEFSLMTNEGLIVLLNYYRLDDIIALKSVTSSYLGLWLELIWRDPARFLAIVGSNLVKYLSPFTAAMKPAAQIYKGLTWLAVFPLAAWGLIGAARRQWDRAGLLILFIAYYILLHGLSYVDDGLVYRYPIQPFLAVFAGYAACQLARFRGPDHA